MGNEKFLNLVKSHASRLQEAQSSQAVDWEKRKLWWINQVDTLLGDVRQWLKALEEQQILTIETKKISINEEDIGSYDVNSMVIKLGFQTLMFKPVASAVVGGFGRVDIEGPGGSVMLLLLSLSSDVTAPDRMNNVAWHIFSHRDRRTSREFDEASFQSIFSSLLLIGGEE